VASDDFKVFARQQGICEAEGGDAICHLADLIRGVGSRVAWIRSDAAKGKLPQFEHRPRALAMLSSKFHRRRLSSTNRTANPSASAPYLAQPLCAESREKLAEIVGDEIGRAAQ
jgi:hypothetical protein